MVTKRLLFSSIVLAALLGAAVAASTFVPVDRTDPKGDVAAYEARRESNDTVAEGQPVAGHQDIDLVRLTSTLAGQTLTVGVEVAGAIRTEGAAEMTSTEPPGAVLRTFSYQVVIDAEADGQAEGVASYQEGEAAFTRMDEGTSEPVPLVARTQGSRLEMDVPVTLFGGVRRVDVSATATETTTTSSGGVGSTETFLDVIEPQPDVGHTQNQHNGKTQGAPMLGVGWLLAMLGLGAVGAARVRQRG